MPNATKPADPRPAEAPPSNALAFRVDDACRMIGVGRTTLYAMRKSGELRFIRIGGRSLVDGDSLRALVG